MAPVTGDTSHIVHALAHVRKDRQTGMLCHLQAVIVQFLLQCGLLTGGFLTEFLPTQILVSVVITDTGLLHCRLRLLQLLRDRGLHGPDVLALRFRQTVLETQFPSLCAAAVNALRRGPLQFITNLPLKVLQALRGLQRRTGVLVRVDGLQDILTAVLIVLVQQRGLLLPETLCGSIRLCGRFID